mmetsp:Transcript_46495/g.92367  ORF Transcript_46495/g.92367 Transcript_46495/m.92367 type:complete len:116 (-) Transcript_46495:35-382(-)
MESATMPATMAQDSMHLRIKRKNTTVFILCYPEQEVSVIKDKIGLMFERNPDTFRLVKADLVLDNFATLRAQQIASNDILHLVYKADNSDTYDKVDFDDLDRLHVEFSEKAKSSS